jgi:hypothetical protein
VAATRIRYAVLVVAQLAAIGVASAAATTHRGGDPGIPVAPGSLPAAAVTAPFGWLSALCDAMATDGQSAMSPGGQDGLPDERGQGRIPSRHHPATDR